MIWATTIDTAAALHHDIVERWNADAWRRRMLRHGDGGTVLERH